MLNVLDVHVQHHLLFVATPLDCRCKKVGCNSTQVRNYTQASLLEPWHVFIIRVWLVVCINGTWLCTVGASQQVRVQPLWQENLGGVEGNKPSSAWLASSTQNKYKKECTHLGTRGVDCLLQSFYKKNTRQQKSKKINVQTCLACHRQHLHPYRPSSSSSLPCPAFLLLVHLHRRPSASSLLPYQSRFQVVLLPDRRRPSPACPACRSCLAFPHPQIHPHPSTCQSRL